MRFKRSPGQIHISLIAVDEEHCVSQWGWDFRPRYLDIAAFINKLPMRPIIGAFTVTATPEVKVDIVNILRLESPIQVTTCFERPNLFFSVLHPSHKTTMHLKLIKDRRGKTGIIYCLTRKRIGEICEKLCQKGYPATRYHAGFSDEERRKSQVDFVYMFTAVLSNKHSFLSLPQTPKIGYYF